MKECFFGGKLNDFLNGQKFEKIRKKIFKNCQIAINDQSKKPNRWYYF
jgi:hypothetical protein